MEDVTVQCKCMSDASRQKPISDCSIFVCMCKVMKEEVPFLETLKENGVEVTDDTRTRMGLFLDAMRRKEGIADRLKEYKNTQSGGADTIPIPLVPSKDDFLGPEMRWFVDVMGSPYAQIALRMLFTVLFFVSYLEKLPVFGGILSAVLDLTVTGGRVLIKTVQKMIPPAIGLIPLPYMSFVGMGVAAVFGLLLWPVIAIISFSRQEFTTAIESMMRVIPPPMGDVVADAFLDVNRTAYRMNERRKKITEDIVSGLRTIMELGNSAKDKVTSGADTLITKLPQVAENPPEAVGGSRQSLSRKGRRKHKWRTQRQRTK